MGDEFDIKKLLDDWPYDPEDNVRVVSGADGREIMQVREPLGIEQYELDGRPDGQRPRNKESALDFYLQKLTQARAAGKEADFSLDSAECAELFAEGVLFYYRYFHLFQVKDWKRVVRDTTRNLRLFDFVNRYADLEEDQMNLEQWRPYIVRMNAVARAMIELEHQKPDSAIKLIRDALRKIEELPELDNPTFKFERERSLEALKDMAGQMEKARPEPEMKRLSEELHQAIEAQEFERAAVLRDRIRELKQKEASA